MSVLSRKLLDRNVIALLEPIADHLRSPEVCEIMVNGDGGIYVEANGQMRREPLRVSRYLLEEAAINVARQYGEDIGPNRPILATRLQDGSRVAIVYPPCSIGGPTIAIRKFQQRLFSMEELVRIGSDVLLLEHGIETLPRSDRKKTRCWSSRT